MPEVLDTPATAMWSPRADEIARLAVRLASGGAHGGHRPAGRDARRWSGRSGGQHLQVVGRGDQGAVGSPVEPLEAGLEFPGEGVPMGSRRSKVALVGPMCARLKATRAAGEDALSW
jgi:hypothetical protein